MVLGFVEDFTTAEEKLDKELSLNSKTGIALNSGVHPSITLDNLLQFLPFPEFTIENYNTNTVYNSYSDSGSRKDIVLFEGDIYQCLQNGTQGVSPANTISWLKTNRESLILKSFIRKVKDRILSDLKLTKRLVNSQYIYNKGFDTVNLQGDYSAWVFEPKGSDYLSFTINEIGLQALTTDPVTIKVINQNTIVDTITVTPQNGVLSFEKVNYQFSGVGSWVFAIESQSVIANTGWHDPLKYDGFTCYPVVGEGLLANTCRWSETSTGNGLAFNISVSLDSDRFIEYNYLNFTDYIKATFEFLALQSFLHNSNNRSNRNVSHQLDKELLMYETKELQANTVAKRYMSSMKEVKRVLEKTFDTHLNLNGDMEIETTSV